MGSKSKTISVLKIYLDDKLVDSQYTYSGMMESRRLLHEEFPNAAIIVKMGRVPITDDNRMFKGRHTKEGDKIGI